MAGQERVQPVLGQRDSVGHGHAKLSQLRSADLNQQGLQRFAASRQVTQALGHEVGAWKPSESLRDHVPIIAAEGWSDLAG
jgi:hypothetical protein